jgi:hypothetical protein
MFRDLLRAVIIAMTDLPTPPDNLKEALAYERVALHLHVRVRLGRSPG